MLFLALYGRAVSHFTLAHYDHDHISTICGQNEREREKRSLTAYCVYYIQREVTKNTTNAHTHIHGVEPHLFLNIRESKLRTRKTEGKSGENRQNHFGDVLWTSE